MLRKRFLESLTARIFVLTALILLGSGAATFGLIAWATPSTYTSVINDGLQKQVDSLVSLLKESSLEASGPLIDSFIRSSRSDVLLLAPDGTLAETGSKLSLRSVQKEKDGQAADSSSSWLVQVEEDTNTQSVTAITATQTYTIFAEVSFADQADSYSLYVTPYAEEENLAVRALNQMAPWILLVLLAFSLLCALLYSRYITRPIVRISGIAQNMAQLDFNWQCQETRRDEIGALSRSLNQMARRLSAALTELEAANRALQKEVERERELDRQRMSFFSAASHELKTPVTILKGQLTGMLEGIDVYRDRDKYLLRSLQVTGRMEKLIQEMLEISRMEAGKAVIRRESLELSGLIEQQLIKVTELLEQRSQKLRSCLLPGILVTGDPILLGRVIENLLSNAIRYSPEGASIRVWCGMKQGCPCFVVDNTDVHIHENALPHLFEAFYREEGSRNRNTGGSGLGLYLVRSILEQHHASCSVENTEKGVRATVRFPSA